MTRTAQEVKQVKIATNIVASGVLRGLFMFALQGGLMAWIVYSCWTLATRVTQLEAVVTKTTELLHR